MAPSEINTKFLQCGHKCNHIGVGEAELAAQLDELSQIGVLFRAEGDNHYCHYVAGDEFIKPVESSDGYVMREGNIYHDARYVYFNKGTPKEVPERFKQYEGASSNIEMAEFLTIEAQDAGYLGDEDNQLSAREALLGYIKEEWPDAEVIDVDLRMDGTFSNRRKYIIYIAGYNLPQTAGGSSAGTKLPEFETKHCPEWMLHEQDITGETSLDGWELIKSPSPLGGEGRGEGEYLAIPRKELKEGISGRLNRTELYAEDLRSRLGFSEYMKGDNPIRLLRDITFIGDDGVAGLECPVFSVDILDIPKTKDNCLAWIERDVEEAIRAKARVKNVAGGYVFQRGNGSFKYISATGRLNIEAIREFITKMTPEKDGYDKEIKAERLTNDPVCSSYELRTEYRKRFDVKKAIESLKRGAEEAQGVYERSKDTYNEFREDYKRYRENEERLLREGLDNLKPNPQKETVYKGFGKEKKKALEEIARSTGGDIHHVRGGDDLSSAIKKALELKEPVYDYQIEFLVDASGSMSGDIKEIKGKGGAILGFAKSQLLQGGTVELGIRSYVDEKFKTWLPLTPMEKNGSGLFRGALHLLLREVGDGGVEPVWDAIVKALKGEAWKPDPSVVKKIIIITDEAGDLTDSGYNKKNVYEMARKMGIVIEVIMLQSSGPGGCFTGDSLLMTENGAMTMSELSRLYNEEKPLPAVATFNERTRELDYQVPDIVFEHDRPNGVEILNLSEEAGLPPLEVTSNHQMLVEDAGEESWIEAGSIARDSSLLFCAIGCNDSYEPVREKETVFIQGATAVYNIHFNDVEDKEANHNYLISPDGIRWFVAHNK